MIDGGMLKCTATKEKSVLLTLEAVAGEPDEYTFATPSGVYLGLGHGPTDGSGSVVTVQEQEQALPIKIFREGSTTTAGSCDTVYLAREKKTVTTGERGRV